MNKLKKAQVIVLFLLPICFAGCKKQAKRTQVKSVNSLNVQEHEARLFDIPVPVCAESLLQEQDYNPKNFVLVYKVDSSVDELVGFYEKQMERLGWKKLAKSNQQEANLLFEKPSKICLVSIRSNKKFRNILLLNVMPRV